jgi:hypothetical protein
MLWRQLQPPRREEERVRGSSWWEEVGGGGGTLRRTGIHEKVAESATEALKKVKNFASNHISISSTHPYQSSEGTNILVPHIHVLDNGSVALLREKRCTRARVVTLRIEYRGSFV